MDTTMNYKPNCVYNIVIDCCLTPNEQCFSYTMARTS